MSSTRRPVSGQTILITGAARGIGAEAARQLARRGARVALAGLEPEALAAVARECGPQAMWVETDVTDTAALERAVAAVHERLGGIDAVVANAGIGSGGMVHLTDPAAFERTVEINLLGTWRTVRATLPDLLERRGYLLVVASVAAILHAPSMAAYSASKAGVEAFADSLRAEIRHRGVHVGVAYFSWIDTDMVRGGDQHPAFSGMRERVRGPGGRTYPVSAAGEAVVAGIERRSRIVVVPGWVRGLMAVRGLLPAIVDRRAAPFMPEIEATQRAAIDSVGLRAASAPVGPGGEAAYRSAASDTGGATARSASTPASGATAGSASTAGSATTTGSAAPASSGSSTSTAPTETAAPGAPESR